MADNKAVNQTAAKPEEAKADKKAKANDGKKKVPFTAKVKNFFGRITKYFRDTKSELKKVVWPSKEDTRNNTITVIVVAIQVCKQFHLQFHQYNISGGFS